MLPLFLNAFLIFVRGSYRSSAHSFKYYYVYQKHYNF